MLSGAQPLLQAPWCWLLSSLCVVFDCCDCSEKTAHFWGRVGEMLQVLLNFFLLLPGELSALVLIASGTPVWVWVVSWSSQVPWGWAVIASLPKAELRAAPRLSWAVNPITGHF